MMRSLDTLSTSTVCDTLQQYCRIPVCVIRARFCRVGQREGLVGHIERWGEAEAGYGSIVCQTVFPQWKNVTVCPGITTSRSLPCLTSVLAPLVRCVRARGVTNLELRLEFSNMYHPGLRAVSVRALQEAGHHAYYDKPPRFVVEAPSESFALCKQGRQVAGRQRKWKRCG